MKRFFLLIAFCVSLIGCTDESGRVPDGVPEQIQAGVVGRDYVVVIGDSISEGHPSLHGRLHPSGATGYDDDYESQPGQLNYEFSRIFGIPFINHGIGGQTTTDIVNRWARDVLAQSVNVGDGRGVSTMGFATDIPYAVFLHVGVNDVFLGYDLQVMKDNFRYIAQSCMDNDITLFASNIGADSVYDEDKERKARDFNDWLSGEFSVEFPDVVLIDYLRWSSGETLDYKYLKPGMFSDTVHPNKSGYRDYAVFAADFMYQGLSERTNVQKNILTK